MTDLQTVVTWIMVALGAVFTIGMVSLAWGMWKE